MIPIKLTIQGLFSYQEKQTIDFRRLTEAHLFGIFGSVGSGKSSILDAITYALYGETERMNARDNRNYNMMNLKSDELFIEFDFSAGKEGTLFRAVVKGKRNRKRFDDVKTLDRSAYQNVGDDWEPIEIEQLQQIIGLSYENFKRTIIIPQGRFQEFLQLGNKDRTQMMKELFNLGKFELYYKTVALETKNNEQMQMLQGQLQQLGEVKPEQLEEAKLRLTNISAEIKLLVSQLALKQGEEVAMNQLKTLFEKLKEQKNIHERLKSKEEDVRKSEQLISEYEFCNTNFKNLFDRSDEIGKTIEKLNQTIINEDNILKNCSRRLSALENDLAVVKPEYDQRELIKQQAGELVKIVRIIELNNENIRITERIKKGEDICLKSAAIIKDNNDRQKQLEEDLRTLKDRIPDLTELSKVQNWYTIKKSLYSTNLEYAKELEIIQKEIDALNSQLVKSTENLFEASDKNSEIGGVIDKLSAKVFEARGVISTIDKNIEHLLIQVKLEEYATNLEEGKPCPLCGSLSHPSKLDGGNVKLSLQKERDSKVVQDKVIEALENKIVSLREIKTQLQLKNESLQKLTLKQVDNRTKIETHQSLFIWPQYQDEELVIKSFKEAESMKVSIKTNESQLDKYRTDLEREQKSLESYRLELEKIREAQTIHLSEINTLSRQVEKVDLQTQLSKSAEQVKKLADSLLMKYAEIESAFLKITSELTVVLKMRDETSGKLQANKLILQEEQNNLSATNAQINRILSMTDYLSADQIKIILNQKVDVESEKQKIQDFRQQLQISGHQIELINKEVGDRVYIAEDHRKLGEELSRLINIQNEKNRELGKTEGEVRKISKDLDQLKEIRRSLDNFELRAEDIKTMKQLFKGSGFVNYVSSVHLHNLCLAANDRFYKLVRQKMSLEITEDNNFQVRDFMNGGKVRSVKTLSGGQTFQAALSLALSLADSIHKFADSSQNFFFLDEGFGSLDKESLDVVFETLKSLRKENRIVGVISHVEEMQQEIDTHLRIVNYEDIGSLISGSWEK